MQAYVCERERERTKRERDRPRMCARLYASLYWAAVTDISHRCCHEQWKQAYSPKNCESPPHHHHHPYHPSTHKRTLSTRALPSVYYLKRNIMYSHLFKKENQISFVNMTLVYKI